MRESLQKREGVWWVPNPVNPLENFADKWEENDRKAKLFFEWLHAVEKEHRDLLTDEGFGAASDSLARCYGETEASVALSRYLATSSEQTTGVGAGPVVLVPRKSQSPTRPPVEISSRPSKPWSE